MAFGLGLKFARPTLPHKSVVTVRSVCTQTDSVSSSLATPPSPPMASVVQCNTEADVMQPSTCIPTICHCQQPSAVVQLKDGLSNNPHPYDSSLKKNKSSGISPSATTTKTATKAETKQSPMTKTNNNNNNDNASNGHGVTKAEWRKASLQWRDMKYTEVT